jgi:hypothetical protein
MDIYLQSCGKKESQEYRWLKIYKDGEWLNKVEHQEPQILEKISQFYQPDTPAVILYRKKPNLILFIYWLKTKQRTLDYRRPVQNSLVFIGAEKDCLLSFQMLASEALEDWQSFAENFDKYVQWADDEYGFQVEPSSRKTFETFLFKKDAVKDSEKLKDPDETRKLACDVLNVKSKSPEKQKILQETKQGWIKKLAEELETTNLPDRDGPLVVVAENVAEEVLQSDVWRGISDRVAHNNESGVWKEIKETEIEEVKKKDPKFYIILAIILISCVVLAIVYSLSQIPKNPTTQPTSEPTIIKPSPSPTPTPITSPEPKTKPSPTSTTSPQLEIQPSPSPTPTTSPEPEIQPSPTPTTSPEPEIQPDSNPESQSSTEIPTQPDSSNPETPKTSSIQEEKLDRENNSPT